MWVPERYSEGGDNEEKRKKVRKGSREGGKERGKKKWDAGEGKIVLTLFLVLLLHSDHFFFLIKTPGPLDVNKRLLC